jgi:hypothetical protein
LKKLFLITNSIGELDWISNYINHLNDEDVTVVFNEFSAREVELLSERYFSKSTFSIVSTIPSSLQNILFYSEKLSRRSRLIRGFFSVFWCYIFRFTKLNSYNDCFGVIFRDQGFRPSFTLDFLRKLNPHSKVIAFPHSYFPIKTLSLGCKDARLLADFVLANTKLCNYFSGPKVIVTGVPSVINSDNLFSASAKGIIIFLRDDYGCVGVSYEKVCQRLKLIFNEAKLLGFDVYVKYHPRKSIYATEQRNLASLYKNVYSFSNFDELKGVRIIFALTFNTSVALQAINQGIPVFDLGCYDSSLFDQSVVHYKDKAGNFTTLFEQVGISTQVFSFQSIPNLVELEQLRSHQKKMCAIYFKSNYFNSIDGLLKSIDE